MALRIGMVLANEPGTVHDVLGRLTRFGLGGAMAGGRQRVSWIHMDDFLAVIQWLEDQPLVDGAINVTAPGGVTNAEWMRAFREVKAMPVGLPSAKWMLEVGARAMGTETELVTKSRWVEPGRLKELGFRWKCPDIRLALVDLEGRRGLDSFFTAPTQRAVGARAWTSEGRVRAT